MQVPSSDMIQSEAEARDYAIEWQHWLSKTSLSYSEVSEWQTYFETLASKFPELKDEFKENGII